MAHTGAVRVERRRLIKAAVPFAKQSARGAYIRERAAEKLGVAIGF